MRSVVCLEKRTCMVFNTMNNTIEVLRWNIPYSRIIEFGQNNLYFQHYCCYILKKTCSIWTLLMPQWTGQYSYGKSFELWIDELKLWFIGYYFLNFRFECLWMPLSFGVSIWFVSVMFCFLPVYKNIHSKPFSSHEMMKFFALHR